MQNTGDNHEFDTRFTPFVLVLSEVVLVLLLEIALETFGSSTSRSTGETPEYEYGRRHTVNCGVLPSTWRYPVRVLRCLLRYDLHRLDPFLKGHNLGATAAAFWDEQTAC